MEKKPEAKPENGPKFLSPETAEIHEQIVEALAKGDFNAVAALATRAAGLEAKAQYDLDITESKIKSRERSKNALNAACDSIASRYVFLKGQTKRNPFLNPDYKAEFDELLAKTLNISSSGSMRKKYDFEETLGDLIGSLQDKLSRMRDSHMKGNENQDASLEVGMAVEGMVSDLKTIRERSKATSGQEMPWGKITETLRKMV